MKKSVIVASTVAVAVALAYPATAWLLGKQVEAVLDDSYSLLAEHPYAKVVKRDYQRGVFGATEVVTIELFGDMMKSLVKAQEGAGAPGSPTEAVGEMKPMQLTFRSEIRHGPVPGFALGAAAVDTELVLDGELKKNLSKLLGDKKPLLTHTVLGFTGGGVSTVTSPAFSTSFQGKGEDLNLAWDGLSITVDFARNLKSYTIRADAPKLEVRDNKGAQVVVSGLHLQGKQKLIFDDEPMLYSGDMRFAIGELSAVSGRQEGDPVLFKQIAYEIDVPVKGDFIDIAAKLGAEVVQVGKQAYGPAHYEVSFNHLHARTMAKLYRAWLKLYSDPAFFSASAEDGSPAKLLAPLGEPALELLRNNPEIRLDRVSFNSKHGEARVAAVAKLKDAKPEDFSNPLMLLAKLEAGADISLPEGLIGEMAGAGPGAAENAARGAMLQQQIAGFAEQGYIRREGGAIKSKIDFANGQLTVNGKPFNPMTMGAPQKSAETR
jgi:uncharacterized protein YdgA (DUF945 family)